MSRPEPVTVRSTLPPLRDERVTLYAAVAAGAIAAGIIDGGLRLILIGLPFLIALSIGVRHRAPVTVAVSVELDADRCVEGDVVDCRIDVNAPAEYAVELAIARATDTVTPADDTPWAWSIPIGVERPVGMSTAILARSWGRSSPGTLEIRLTRPGSLIEHRATVVELPVLTVLPASRRLDELMRIDRAPAAAGAHPTRSMHGGGYEFSEVRDYRPGDRLRDLNWTASLRRDEPAVNQRLPERAGDVMIVIDTFPDALRRHSEVSRDVIVRTGRLAWAVASAHLAVNDRVGLVVEGSRPEWVAPQSGRRAKYALFSTLLTASSSSVDTIRNPLVKAHRHIPTSATVIAVSPLARPRTIDSLVALRARGHRVEVVALDIADDLRRHAPRLPEEIVRVRSLIFSERVAALRRNGVSVVVSAGDEDGIAMVRALRHLPNRAVRMP
jgi:uncharacterized protein (DUF58 family)